MKAVSPLVATAILLVVTVAGGVILYNYMVNTLTSPKESATLSVVSAKMLIDVNKTIINLKIANIGTTDAEISKVVIIPDNITINTDLVIEPGTTKSFNIVLNTALDETMKHYIVVVYGDQETEPVTIKIIG